MSSLYIFDDLNSQFFELLHNAREELRVSSRNLADSECVWNLFANNKFLQGLFPLLDSVYIFCDELPLSKGELKSNILNLRDKCNEELKKIKKEFDMEPEGEWGKESEALYRKRLSKYYEDMEKFVSQKVLKPYKIYCLKKEIELEEEELS